MEGLSYRGWVSVFRPQFDHPSQFRQSALGREIRNLRNELLCLDAAGHHHLGTQNHDSPLLHWWRAFDNNRLKTLQLVRYVYRLLIL